MSEEAPKPEETPTSPEMKLGCLTGFAGVCLLLALPRMSVVLIVVGAVLFFFPHYLLIPIGQPKDPKTGEVKPRPTYSASARSFTYIAFALAVLLGYYGLQKDLGRTFAPQSSPPPPAAAPPQVAAPQVKATSTIVYEVTGSTDSASLTYRNASGGTDQMEVSLPWSKTFEAAPGAFLYLSAQNQNDYGALRVQVKVDGIVAQEGETNAEYGIATASGKL